MDPIVALFIGLTLGWLFQWLIDVFYWRKRRVCTDEELELSEAVSELKTEKETLVTLLVDVRASHMTRLAELESQLAVRSEFYRQMERQLADFGALLVTERSNIVPLPAGNPQSQTESIIASLREHLAAHTAAVSQLRNTVESNYSTLETSLATVRSEMTIKNIQSELTTSSVHNEERQTMIGPSASGPASSPVGNRRARGSAGGRFGALVGAGAGLAVGAGIGVLVSQGGLPLGEGGLPLVEAGVGTLAGTGVGSLVGNLSARVGLDMGLNLGRNGTNKGNGAESGGRGSGVDGVNDGRDGRDGHDGRDGRDGRGGRDGRDGREGLDGTDGDRGPGSANERELADNGGGQVADKTPAAEGSPKDAEPVPGSKKASDEAKGAAKEETPVVDETPEEEKAPEEEKTPAKEETTGVESASRTSSKRNNLYHVVHQWGDATAPWRSGGAWVLGGRDGQHIVALNCTSNDDGSILTGTCTYDGEEPIGFRARMTANNTYQVENQLGRADAPWQPAGTWLIGARLTHHIVALDITSSDGGQTLTGKCTYSDEEPITFRCSTADGGVYVVHSTGSEEDGCWVIGDRGDRSLQMLRCTSRDGGRTLLGTCSYDGENIYEFRSARWACNTYDTEYREDAESEWVSSGIWVIGSAFDKNLVTIELASTDGEILTGPCAYEGEAPEQFTCRFPDLYYQEILPDAAEDTSSATGAGQPAAEGLDVLVSDKLQDLASDASDKLQELTSGASDKLQDLTSDVSDKLQNLKPDVPDELRDLSSAMHDNLQDLTPDVADRLQELAPDVLDELRDLSSDVSDELQDLTSDIPDNLQDLTSDKSSSEPKDEV